MGAPITRSAITEWDGVTVNAGYLALVVMLRTVVGVLVFMCAAAAVTMVYAPLHAIDLREFATAIATALAAFALFLPAVGAYVYADRKNDPPPQPTPLKEAAP